MAVDSNARLLAIALAGQGGGEGTSDYTQLSNKPKINNVVLVGNKSLSDLGINIPTNVSDLTNDAGYITSADITGKQDKLTAGTNITIDATNTISATGISYTAGTGIEIVSNEISVDEQVVATKADLTGKANVSDLADVAFSGDYDDLENKPTIPVIPTNVSYFTNDAGYLTEHQDISHLATKAEITGKANISDLSEVAFSGDYDDLDNTPTIPTKVSDLTNDSGFITDADITGKANVSDLAEVAFSGDYDDLDNKPTIPVIPTNVSYFTNDAGYLTSHQDITGKEDISNKVTSVSASSTDTEYPTAKCLYDALGNIESALEALL